ncbi:putative protein N(5)-glutamine methyltransferase [Streptomyces monticola]|uniref:peptide chain release factor N(5)-glutamine methyltransferase n=1 Tax=Streptomyces monticola TaxID=2666263 RepID=A0ABW2JFJ8_9ACTN
MTSSFPAPLSASSRSAASPAVTAGIVERLRAAGCVFAEDEAALMLSTARGPAELDAMVGRRVRGFPLEQVLGWAEFCGLRVTVAPGVFVPRRRTEFLVAQATALLREANGGDSTDGTDGSHAGIVLDLCCGTGAVGVAVAAALGPGSCELHAADIDPVAVACARGNLAAAGGRVYESDLYAALPRELLGRVGLLVANAPYVPTDAIALLPPEARDHEPLVALDGGADGLDVQRRVAEGAARWLTPGGQLLIETSERQAARTVAAVARGGLEPRVAACEELGATVVIGAKPDRSTAQGTASATASAPVTAPGAGGHTAA